MVRYGDIGINIEAVGGRHPPRQVCRWPNWCDDLMCPSDWLIWALETLIGIVALNLLGHE